MTAWRGMWERYLGLPEAGAGEGTLWTWSFSTPWPQGWPAWLACLMAAALIVSVVWSYRREAAALAWWQRVVLCTLRFAALAVALLLWSQPTLLVARTGLPPVAIAVDASGSMSLRDAGGETSAARLAQPELGGGDGLRRWDLAVNSLTADNGRLLQRLLAAHPLRLYRFADEAAPMGPAAVSRTEQLAEALLALEKVQPDGLQTRPAEAVRQILAALRGLAPAALVIFTDGVASESDSDKLSTVADLVRRRGVQLIVVPVGSSVPVRDLHLYDVVMDDVAFVGDPVLMTGVVRATGASPASITVQVTREGESQPLAQQQLSVRGDGAQRFELTVTPSEPGEWDLVIAALPLEGEVQKDNNQERRHLSIRQEKQKVLLVESAPRYEFRYLKQWCEREKSIELNTLLLEADPEYAQEDRTARTYFPVQRDELWAYDVVLLGDVAPAQLGAAAPGWLMEFVRDKGGGLVLLSGPRFNPRAFEGTPLESVLPFPFEAWNQAVEQNATTSYQPQLTLDGQRGVPLFRFGESETASLQIWNALPGFYGVLPIQRLKPGVRVLAQHPSLSGESERLPVITLQQVGAGKVLFHATDETWRWRFRTGDQYFGRYWGHAVRYLSRGRLLGKDRTAELVVDRQVYRRGEPVLLRVRFVDERQAPPHDDGVQVVVEQAGQGRRELTLARVPYLPTVFEGHLTQLEEGAYHAWVSTPSFSSAPPVADFRVESLQRELQKRSVDLADLKLAADRAGGRLLSLGDVSQLPGLIPSGDAVPLETGATVSLWNRFEPLVLLAGLLMSEWVLRRRWRLV